MPVIGIEDPSFKERSDDMATRLPRWLTVEQVLAAALASEPTWAPYNYELLNAALGEIQERGDAISTTALTSPCPRSTVLERKESYILSVDAIWRAFRGTMVHYVLEHAARPGSIAEHRFFMELAPGQEISCSPDLVTPDTIWDYKNTAKNPTYGYVYKSHGLQLQTNRLIVNNASRVEFEGEPVTEFPFDYRSTVFQHLAIMYLDIDGPKPIEVTQSVQVGNRKRRMPHVWEDEEVLEWVLPRYRALRAALEVYPEWPDGVEDVWGGPPGWACPGRPWCRLPNCLAKRYPNGLVWEGGGK